MLGLVGLNACSTVKVRTDPDQAVRQGVLDARLLGRAAGGLVEVFADTSVSLLGAAGKLAGDGHTEEAAACFLKAAVDARELLESGTTPAGSGEEAVLVDLHNQSLARFAELWIGTPGEAGGGTDRLVCHGEIFEPRLAPDSAYPPGFWDRVLSARAVQIKGVVRQGRDGLGAALAGIREPRPERAAEMSVHPPRGLYVAVTMTLDTIRKGPEATVVTLSLRNPAVEQHVAADGRMFPLAADFSAPVAVWLSGRNEWLWGLDGFFHADERAAQSGIYLLEPYDPGRIPVLLIHGLVSVPIIWRDTVPAIQADPELAKRYQFFVFTYPSSYPLIESALLLREELAALRQRFDPDGTDPLSTNLVAAGHSMGGILARTLMTDMGESLWKQFSDLRLEELPLDSPAKDRVRKLVEFKPDPAVRRAIFYSVPHRGAEMAQGGLVNALSRTARLPGNVLQFTSAQLDRQTAEMLRLKVNVGKKTTSVQSLQPGSPMITALEASPIRPGVSYHSIIGDRGKGDSPESSDGVVEYWSSHLEGAASERIVPTNHSCLDDPATIAETIRILREHAGLR